MKLFTCSSFLIPFSMFNKVLFLKVYHFPLSLFYLSISLYRFLVHVFVNITIVNFNKLINQRRMEYRALKIFLSSISAIQLVFMSMRHCSSTALLYISIMRRLKFMKFLLCFRLCRQNTGSIIQSVKLILMFRLKIFNSNVIGRSGDEQ